MRFRDFYRNKLHINEGDVVTFPIAGARQIHKGQHLTIHQINTPNAAKVHSAGALWDDAEQISHPGSFHQLHSLGPMYVIKHNTTGERHFLHIAEPSSYFGDAGRFVDSNNKRQNLHDFSEKYPEIKDVPQLKNSIYGPLLTKNNDELRRHLNTAPIEVLVHHPKLPRDILMDTMKNHKNPFIRADAYNNPSSTSEDLWYGVKHDGNANVQETLVTHPKLSKKQAMYLVKHSNFDTIRADASLHHEITTDDLEHPLFHDKENSSIVRAVAASHPATTADQLVRLYHHSDDSALVRGEVVRNKKTPAHVLRLAFKHDPDKSVREIASRRLDLTEIDKETDP